MRKHKFTRISKYVTLSACLCFLLTTSFTYSRYSEKGSDALSSADISNFDVSCQLFDENNKEVTDLSVETSSISSYSATYYLLIVNDSSFDITYSISINDPFYFSSDTKTSGVISTIDSERIPLSIYIDSSKLEEGVTSYDISIGVDIIQGSTSISEEIPDDAVLITSSNILSTTFSGTVYYYLEEDIEVSGYITINGDVTINLNNNNLILDNTGGYSIIIEQGASLTLAGQGIITNSSGGGIYINSGATLSMSMESVEYCSSIGVYVSNGSTFNVSGAPIINNNSSANVYLESDALITLSGSIVRGAYIGVTHANNTGQITPEEENTTHYVNAKNYIHSDDLDYKVTRSSNGHGLILMDATTVNFTVALQDTGSSHVRDFYIAGAEASHEGDWDHNFDNYYAYMMHSYLGYEYDYDYYYDFGEVSLLEGFNFAVGGYEYYSDLFDNGIARSDSLTFSENSASNFYLWATQYYEGSGEEGDWSENSEWGFNFEELTNDSELYSTNEFTIVLMLDFGEVKGNWDQYDNVVTDFYFILDGDTVYKS